MFFFGQKLLPGAFDHLQQNLFIILDNMTSVRFAKRASLWMIALFVFHARASSQDVYVVKHALAVMDGSTVKTTGQVELRTPISILLVEAGFPIT